MSISPDDLVTLRSKLSDDQIIEGLSKTDPTDASDIKALQGKGVSNTKILDGFTKFHTDNPPKSAPSGVIDTAYDLGSKAIGALRHGVADEFNREGATSEVLSGTPSVASTIGKAINDPSYDPASNHAGFGSMDAASYIPRAIVESLPSQGSYLMAGAAGGALGSAVPVVGTGIGALLGAGAYGLSRYLGTNAKERAANDGHAGNVTNSDIIGALPGSAGQAALDAVGSRYLAQNALLKAVPVTGAGLDAMKQTGKNILKTAGVDAATSGANAAVGQAGTEIGTQAGYHPDAGQIATSAGIGGLAGFGMKAAGSVPESIMNIRQTKSDPTIRTQLADDLNSTRVTGDPSNKNDNGAVLKSAFSMIGNDLQKAGADKVAQLKAQGQNPASSPLLGYVNDLATNLKSRQLDPDQIAEAKQKLADEPTLLNPILKMNELYNIGKQSNLKEFNQPENAPQGLSPHQLIHSVKWPSMLGMSALGAGAAGHMLTGGLLSIIPAVAVAARLKAGLMGDRDYVNQYTKRFGTPEGAPGVNVPGQAQPQAPQEPQAPITDPRQLLNRPPIYAPGPTLPQGVHPDHFAQEPPAPQQQAPQAAPEMPQQQLRLPAPVPTIQAGRPNNFRDQRGAEIPDNLLMLRAALAKANEAASSDQAPGDPQQAQGAPQGSATPPQTPQGQQSPQGRGKAQKAGEDSSAQKASKDTNAPQAKQSAPQPSFNEQADAIEQSIKQSRDTIADPNSSPGEIAAAKASLRKAALEAAGQHDASAGGARAPKGAKAAGGGGSSSGHAKASSAPKGAHAPEASSGKSEGSAEGASGANGKGGEVFHVQTKHGKVTLHEKSTRRNQEVQAAGIVKRVNTRDEVGRAVSQLPLSAAGHAAAKAKVPELMHNVLHLSSASEAKTALNHFLGSFSGKDHAILGNHFNNFRASSGQNFLGTWKHGDEKMAKAARVKNEAINKGKKTRASNKDAEKK